MISAFNEVAPSTPWKDDSCIFSICASASLTIQVVVQSGPRKRAGVQEAVVLHKQLICLQAVSSSGSAFLIVMSLHGLHVPRIIGSLWLSDGLAPHWQRFQTRPGMRLHPHLGPKHDPTCKMGFIAWAILFGGLFGGSGLLGPAAHVQGLRPPRGVVWQGHRGGHGARANS